MGNASVQTCAVCNTQDVSCYACHGNIDNIEHKIYFCDACVGKQTCCPTCRTVWCNTCQTQKPRLHDTELTDHSRKVFCDWCLDKRKACTCGHVDYNPYTCFGCKNENITYCQTCWVEHTIPIPVETCDEKEAHGDGTSLLLRICKTCQELPQNKTCTVCHAKICCLHFHVLPMETLACGHIACTPYNSSCMMVCTCQGPDKQIYPCRTCYTNSHRACNKCHTPLCVREQCRADEKTNAQCTHVWCRRCTHPNCDLSSCPVCHAAQTVPHPICVECKQADCHVRPAVHCPHMIHEREQVHCACRNENGTRITCSSCVQHIPCHIQLLSADEKGDSSQHAAAAASAPTKACTVGCTAPCVRCKQPTCSIHTVQIAKRDNPLCNYLRMGTDLYCTTCVSTTLMERCKDPHCIAWIIPNDPSTQHFEQPCMYDNCTRHHGLHAEKAEDCCGAGRDRHECVETVERFACRLHEHGKDDTWKECLECDDTCGCYKPHALRRRNVSDAPPVLPVPYAPSHCLICKQYICDEHRVACTFHNANNQQSIHCCPSCARGDAVENNL